MSPNMTCPPNKGFKMNRCSAKPGLYSGYCISGQTVFIDKNIRKARWLYVDHLGVSENSVPLNPMVNDHYPYYINGYFIGNIPYFQTNPFSERETMVVFRKSALVNPRLTFTFRCLESRHRILDIPEIYVQYNHHKP